MSAVGVPAAPNRSRMTARVLAVRQSPQFADRWLLRIRVEQVRPIAGGTFAAAGQERDAFVFGARPPSVGDVLDADAEYVGGPSGGAFRLTPDGGA
jgi:hypothetical protein